MQVIKTMRPGHKGARRFERRFGKRLCAVRYRNSPCGKKVLTTVELIVDEREKPAPGVSHAGLQAYQRAEPVALSVGAEEHAMQRLLKQAGARWSQKGRAWVATRELVATLGLNHRIVEGLIDACEDVDATFEL
ncbi:hypothetical protein [Microbulbifer guangxiensis]|uniref:hypothetical protein n=1 Tax=Microbulbifer guangxiensis TaxID=2904249 RepID=UPI001F291A5D|nr:hypothetical protein [Microbulbifer guangxiensis]